MKERIEIVAIIMIVQWPLDGLLFHACPPSPRRAVVGCDTPTASSSCNDKTCYNGKAWRIDRHLVAFSLNSRQGLSDLGVLDRLDIVGWRVRFSNLDVDFSWLHRLWNFALQFDLKQAVFE
jgi:hypothetical protein